MEKNRLFPSTLQRDAKDKLLVDSFATGVRTWQTPHSAAPGCPAQPFPVPAQSAMHTRELRKEKKRRKGLAMGTSLPGAGRL